MPLALQGCAVHANDLNPKSHKYLEENIKRNKVRAGLGCGCGCMMRCEMM